MHPSLLASAGSLFLAIPGFGVPEAERLLDVERYRDRVRLLASEELEGRGTGSAGQQAAARYIASRFRSFGLDPGGDEGSYFQRFRVRIPRPPRVGPSSRLEVTTSAGKESLERGGFLPFGFSPDGEVSGPLVFVGYSITSEDLRYDDYQGIDVRDKVVLCLRHSPGEAKPDSPFGPAQNQIATFVRKAQNAAAAGAKALLLVHDANHREDQMIALGISGEKASIPVVQVKQSFAEKLLARSGKTMADIQKGIDDTLRPNSFALEGMSASLRIEVERPGREEVATENVIGILPGADPELAGECVVIGAHFDHVGLGDYGAGAMNRGKIHHGADDNASGTAAVIELAYAFSKLDPRPRRSVIFVAFSAEELGLYGSAHYVKHPSFPIVKTVAMLNLDMVGRAKQGAYEAGGVGTAEGLEELIASQNEGIGLQIKFVPQVSEDSDHYNFSKARVPVVFFFSGYHEDYHTPTDTWEKIQAEDAVRVVRLTLRLAAELANAERRLEYSEPPRRRRS